MSLEKVLSALGQENVNKRRAEVLPRLEPAGRRGGSCVAGGQGGRVGAAGGNFLMREVTTPSSPLSGVTYAAKGYFDALVKMGELASESQGSKELGKTLKCGRDPGGP